MLELYLRQEELLQDGGYLRDPRARDPRARGAVASGRRFAWVPKALVELALTLMFVGELPWWLR
ncbi:MAG: hypothetical protein JXA74_12765 [Anaerolineae bacterium]|nr:hypothetical protein [Anaerolineae bacterium]